MLLLLCIYTKCAVPVSRHEGNRHYAVLLKQLGERERIAELSHNPVEQNTTDSAIPVDERMDFLELLHPFYGTFDIECWCLGNPI
jgi:hypothetical protein